MELTFVNQYGNSTPKRRRLAKACDSCRSRKKRCIHVAAADRPKENEDGAPHENGESIITNGIFGAQTRLDSNSHGTPDNHANGTPMRKTSSGARRFISDLNPESTFLQRSLLATQGEIRPQNDDIGIWVDKREWDALVRQKNTTNAEATRSASHNNQRPHSAVLGPLIDIYFRKINPIIPLLDEGDFRKNHAAGLVPEPLAHALCLVAAKDSEAGPHLRLNESDTSLAPREFCSRLHASVMGALRVPCRFDKITLIRILALASLHAEGQDGAEEATMCANQAMHYSQTMGLHLGQHAGAASSDDLTTKRLFWCLWSIDRLNSCIYGRPIMMGDIDIAIEPFELGESGFPAFEVWLYICRMMNTVINFYRPGNSITTTGWEDDFPSFEDAMDAGRAWDQPQSVLVTLHLFYLLVAVLSHRSRGVKYIPRSTNSYVRQNLCAIELNRMMSSPVFASLHPLPILPYAISLALSVSYQHLRQAQLQHQQEVSKNDFRACCQVLQKLRRTWSSADVIATIAKKVLDELDKATDLSSFRVSRFDAGRGGSPGICTASLSKPHTLIDAANDTNGHVDTAAMGANEQPGGTPTGGYELFAGMDDVFNTWLDPNYPVNLDDFSFVDDLSPIDWDTVPT